MSIISDMMKYSRLAFGMRGFLRSTITLEESKQFISARLHNRQKNFLALLQKGIYQNPKSPYLKLLRIAGCEYGDLESLVNRDGIETTLQKLLADGVYLSWEEFKGKKDLVRGVNHIHCKESDFDNPFLPVYYQTQSSGSRSAGTRTTFDLKFHSEASYYRMLTLAVNNAMDVPLGIWLPVLPAGSGISSVLHQWKVGKPVARWFSPVDERQVQSSLQHRLAMKYLIYGSRLWGAKLVKPEYVGLEEAASVARWISDTMKKSGGCCLMCSPSSAVKVCQKALENQLDIQGTFFIVTGEPLTQAKRRQIEITGATVTSRYVISEIGIIGCGCPGADSIDRVHFFHDSMALIQHRRKVEPSDINVNAFLFTGLQTSAPKIVLNVESDDYGVVETSSCSCLFGELGFNTHLHNIRSFSKLTGMGMTLIGTEFVRILEEVLPGKYGGTATDYQLLEEEDGQGKTNLSLIIDPTIGKIDEGDVIATIFHELSRSPQPNKLTAGVWSGANMFQVKRMHPVSRMGKIMTLHLIKKD